MWQVGIYRAIKCQILRYQKNSEFILNEENLEFWAINWHKGIKICSIDEQWAMVIQVIFNFGDGVYKHPFTAWRANDRVTVSIGDL